MAIRDWPEKQKAIIVAGGARNQEDLVAKIFKLIDKPGIAVTSIKSPKLANPDAIEATINLISETFKLQLTAKEFIEISAQNFEVLLHNHDRASEITITRSNPPNVMFFSTEGRVTRSIHQDKNKGKLDDAAIYDYSDSAEIWKHLSEDRREYDVYPNCLSSLAHLTSSTEWKKIISDNCGFINVLAGGGSASKDYVIQNSIKDKSKWTYSLFDSSGHMLRLSYVKGRNNEGQNEFTARYQANIFDLPKEFHSENSDGMTVWFLLGNTLNNLDEHLFMERICAYSKAGDFLVIGGEFLPENMDKQKEEKVITKLKKQYLSDKIKMLLTPRLLHLAHEMKVKCSIPEIVASMDINIRSNEFIQGTLEPYLFAMLDSTKIELSKTSRYPLDNFINYIEKWNEENVFKHVKSFASKANVDYMQVLFRRL